ncbi:MAG: hypothetical protein ACR2MG_08400 [Pyrinomonadaceae bacterium]
MRISEIRNSQEFQDLCQQLLAAEYEDFEILVEQLPILQANESEQKRMSKMVSEVLEKRKSGIDTNDIEKSIDEFVFELYQITSQEAKFLLSASSR